MRVFNLDGSEAEACGSPIRCAAKYLYDKRLVTKEEMSIEMKSGIKNLYVETRNALVSSVIVDMGKAECSQGVYDGIKFTSVSVGNPHCVIFLDNDEILDMYDVAGTGAALENNRQLFPERTNVEFVKVINKNTFKMRVWERGNGETLASGTGATAAVAAAVLNGFANEGEDVKVIQAGGELIVNYTEDAVYMTGGCREVFEGTVLI
jgi:carbamoyl-phosphate synthase large subunit